MDVWKLANDNADTVSEWLRMLLFSDLNRSSSHRCGFEPSSGHMWDKPSSDCGWSGGFSRGSPIFALLTIDPAQNEWNNLDGQYNPNKKKKKLDNCNDRPDCKQIGLGKQCRLRTDYFWSSLIRLYTVSGVTTYVIAGISEDIWPCPMFELQGKFFRW